jgi:hypothetical protein
MVTCSYAGMQPIADAFARHAIARGAPLRLASAFAKATADRSLGQFVFIARRSRAVPAEWGRIVLFCGEAVRALQAALHCLSCRSNNGNSSLIMEVLQSRRGD